MCNILDFECFSLYLETYGLHRFLNRFVIFNKNLLEPPIISVKENSHLPILFDIRFKRKNARRKKISTREELNRFFGRIHLYFSPIRSKSLFLNHKNIYFNLYITYFVKRNFRIPFLRKFWNKICDVMWGGENFNLKNGTQ